MHDVSTLSTCLVYVEKVCWQKAAPTTFTTTSTVSKPKRPPSPFSTENYQKVRAVTTLDKACHAMHTSCVVFACNLHEETRTRDLSMNVHEAL